MGEDLKGRVGVAISRGDDGVELSETTDHAFEQLSSRCDIPVKYTKLRDTVRHRLLVDNFNSWVHDGQSRMVRTLWGRVRAILSDRYKAVDMLRPSDRERRDLGIIRHADAHSVR